jgi:hypothetical protein
VVGSQQLVIPSNSVRNVARRSFGSGFEHLGDGTVVTDQVGEEGLPRALVDAFVGEQLPHVEEVAWMLAIERSNELAGVEIGERHQLGAGEAEPVVPRARERRERLRRVHTAPQDGRDLELHLGPAALDDHLRHRSRTEDRHGTGMAAGMPARSPWRSVRRPHIDGGEGRLAVRDWQERQVEVDRQPWHSAVEEVDRGPALQREVLLVGKEREHANEERYAFCVPLSRRHRGSVGR